MKTKTLERIYDHGLMQVVHELEHRLIRFAVIETLKKFNGNLTHTADALKVDRANFYRFIRKYQIDLKEFR